MLVYRGMSIGTAKPDAEERSGIRYFGIDLVEPHERFSTWRYREYALSCFREHPEDDFIVAGGTGLYVRALTDGLQANPAMDPAFHERWQARVQEEGIEVLQQALRDADAAAFDALEDPLNPRRLIRALELSGESKAERHEWPEARAPITGLCMPNEHLKARITQRVERMYASGLLEEVEGLLSSDEFSGTAGKAIGYAEAIACLAGECSQEEAGAKTVSRTWQLARRQMTWFRHQAAVDWIDVEPGMDIGDIAESVNASWRTHGYTEIAE